MKSLAKHLAKQGIRNSNRNAAVAKILTLPTFHNNSLLAVSSSSARCYASASSAAPQESLYDSLDTFARRHNSQVDLEGAGQNASIESMLQTVGVKSVEELIEKTIPTSIYNPELISNLDKQFRYKTKNVEGETDILEELKNHYAAKNKVLKSLIGMGYSGTITPPVILRNVLESPAWYTPYTPYQAEISQGRLESLINYQTMITDLTGLDISNASLLDEGTAAAEAATMCLAVFLNNNKSYTKEENRKKPIGFVVAKDVHPQTIDVIKTRMEPLHVEVIIADDIANFDFANSAVPVCGTLLQYPGTDGSVHDYTAFVKKAHEAKALVVCAADILSLTVLKAPGEFGADIAVGTNQRFGIPFGYGGPHAGYLATRDEYKRMMPGRIIGVSKDSNGKRAYRMSLQTREQHIRRDKATSNICTAQALLSNISAFYAIYHGPKGLRKIAEQTHRKAVALATGLKSMGYTIFGGENTLFFDTIRVDLQSSSQVVEVMKKAVDAGYNLRRLSSSSVTIAVDETTTGKDIDNLFQVFSNGKNAVTVAQLESKGVPNAINASSLNRTSEYLTHPVFNSFHTEHELLRYIYRLQNRDISLAQSMIPLGSCTMKLNATSEMIPVTWKEMGQVHPFVPLDQAKGYQEMFDDLQNWLCTITGFDGISLQPNSGAQGEYAGLMVIRKYYQSIGQGHRNVCLIPVSAHGTNPASAAMAAMKVVVVKCDKNGNVDLADLKQKAEENKDNLAAVMVTYPSTHGVFEEGIKDLINIVHQNGGQVYMDGANMNAQVGLTAPGYIGADVCHLNLHKTFCIPHGGGGPGMGPIGVKAHLKPFLPNHPVVPSSPGKPGTTSDGSTVGAISAAPFGSSSILPISWMYIRMMGGQGLKRATQIAILNANYMAKRLENHYKIFYRGTNGFVAHELILDINPFKKTAHIEAEDIAKRLMDYGFHAPTMSFPISGTLMIEPTESESKEEIDRYIDALISIREEIRAIEDGKADAKNNVLKNAPHTAHVVMSDKWDRPYTRQQAAYPAPWLNNYKFWPSVGRIDSSYGDLNLFCVCPPLESYQEPASKQ